jgi:Domain of unknown function (DUF1839)
VEIADKHDVGCPESARHWLHSDPTVPWGVSNCYVDLWLEVLHWLGFEPLAAFAFCVTADYRDDHWTFLKPPLPDLESLYGLDVSELAISRPMADHVDFHLARGRVIVTEADAYHLPDTAATSYRTFHGKTAIAVTQIDVPGRRLQYFHDSGFHALEGEDFDRLFGAPDSLAPYVELVDLARLRRLPASELAACATTLLRTHLERRPSSNPFARWLERFPQDLARLDAHGEAAFHDYAFTHIRQAGAAFQYAGCFVDWLDGWSDCGLRRPAADLASLAKGAKVFMLRLARTLAAGRAWRYDAELSRLAETWDSAMGALEDSVMSSPLSRRS